MRSFLAFSVLGLVVVACGSDGDDDAAPGGGGSSGAGTVSSGGNVASSGAPGGSSGASGTVPGDAGGDGSTPGDTCAAGFGTYLKPYAVDSPWNTRPVAPVLGTATIPDSINGWRPVISDGAGYSTGVFLAAESDPPMVVHGTPTIFDKDTEFAFDAITIPHWPADVSPATESDGHADVVDPSTHVVHSFNGVKHLADGSWQARDYAWSKLDGRGWGDPAHYFQGARATGVPASAGIVRKHEFLSADPVYHHALSLSLPHNAIKHGDGDAPTAYVYPATSADSADPSLPNSGQIPEGSLLMLPADFDSSTMPTPELVRIAETLKTYGAYVTDRNSATPYNIYVEIGTGYSLGGQGANIDAALATVQHALRPLASATSWVDGCEQPAVREPALELQSMRGKWAPANSGTYQTWEQAVVFTQPGETQTSGWNNRRTAYGNPEAGKPYRVSVESTGGGTLRYQVTCSAQDGATPIVSTVLQNGGTFDFTWPAGTCTPFLTVSSGSAAGLVRGHLRAAN